MNSDKGLREHYLFISFVTAMGMGIGFLRELAIAYYLGSDSIVDVYRLAFGLPGILSEGVATSLVSAYFVAFSGNGNLELDRARSGRLFFYAFLLFTIITLCGILTIGIQKATLAPGLLIDDIQSFRLISISGWLSFLVINLASYIRAAASYNDVRWVGAMSMVVRSGAFTIIFSFSIYFQLYTDDFAIGFAIFASSIALILFNIYSVRGLKKIKISFFFPKDINVEEFRGVSITILVVLASQLLLASGRLIDRSIASSHGAGAVAALEYSYSVVLAVASVIIMVATILFLPAISSFLASPKALSKNTIYIFTMCVVLISVLGLILSFNSQYISEIIFQRGAFTADDAEFVSEFLRYHGLALGPIVFVVLINQTLILLGKAALVSFMAIAKLFPKILVIGLLLTDSGLSVALGVSLVVGELFSLFLGCFFIYRYIGKRYIS